MSDAIVNPAYGPLEPTIAIAPPRAAFFYEAVVEIGQTMSLGNGPLGERRMVPILGGVFAGPDIRGKVLPGGADRQLLRHDGILELDALYEMQTEDGAIITVRNRAIIDAPPDGPRYAFSKLDFSAPAGPHARLNRRAFVGTVTSLRPRSAVLIRVFALVEWETA